MEITIRNASKKDISSILELLYELGRPKPIDKNEVKFFEDIVKDYFSDKSKFILVAELNSKIIGLVSIIFLRRLNRTNFEMYIPELVVRNDFRYSGIGKQLISECVILAKSKNCYRIRLESANIRKESHEFYKNLGFEQYGLSFSLNL